MHLLVVGGWSDEELDRWWSVVVKVFGGFLV